MVNDHGNDELALPDGTGELENPHRHGKAGLPYERWCHRQAETYKGNREGLPREAKDQGDPVFAIQGEVTS